MSDIRIEVRLARLNAALDLLAPTVTSKLKTFLAAFAIRLVGQIKTNIVSIYRSTGPLYQSVGADVRDDRIVVSTHGIPYARILEEGGHTRAHMIVPRSVSVLAFEGPAGLVFAKRVNHPGSNVPARPYASLAMTQLRYEFDGGIREVVAAAKGELQL